MNDSTKCLVDTRRRFVRRRGGNGLDYVDVGDAGGHFGGGAQAQNFLTVHFLGRLHTAGAGENEDPREWPLAAANFRITGGRRITEIQVIDAMVVRPEAADEEDLVVLKLDRAGDFSCYTLEISDAPPDARPTREGRSGTYRSCEGRQVEEVLQNFDQRYRQVSFSFKADCPSPLDCVGGDVCTRPANPPPAIDYLAKDYAGFREFILDRLALSVPDWRERHIPDVGIALVEILAYAADRLSYYQDAVAQEAYLETARRRVSVRRHARLVGYFLHEGCNARAWVCISPASPVVLLPDFALLTESEDATSPPLVFEPVIRQRGAHLEIGDFFDLAGFAADLPDEIAKRLPANLRDALKNTANGLPAEFAARLISNLNSRVLGDPTFAAGDVPAGDNERIVLQNRGAFDSLCTAYCVPLGAVFLTPAHREMRVYSWHNTGCCLEAGATECVLWDVLPNAAKPAVPPIGPGDPLPVAPRVLRLRVGEVIIFEEILGPQTGSASDADPSHRHAVRLTAVIPEVDALTGTPIVRIVWTAEDALPFSFCLSCIGPPPECKWLDSVTVVRGNVVLVDHGESLPPEELGTVEIGSLNRHCRCVGILDEVSARPLPFYPALDALDPTFAVPMRELASATRTVTQKPWMAVAALAVTSRFTESADTQWSTVLGLFDSGPQDRRFVVEMDDVRRAWLRFGDGSFGRRPAAGETFRARYRTGNGPAGNVGHDSIVVFRKVDGSFTSEFVVRNPLAACGGTAPESIDHARRNAPYAFRLKQLRAVTADDYARLAEKDPRVQRAGAEIRWTGSRQAVCVALDPLGTTAMVANLTTEVRDALLEFRRIGHDLQVIPARYTAIELGMEICVLPTAVRGAVEAAARDALTAGLRRDGTPGFFHPDRLTFGEPVRISPIVAVVQNLPGVMNVRVTVLHRWGGHPCGELAKGYLAVGALEVARLDQDSDFPENGTLTLNLGGGR